MQVPLASTLAAFPRLWQSGERPLFRRWRFPLSGGIWKGLHDRFVGSTIGGPGLRKTPSRARGFFLPGAERQGTGGRPGAASRRRNMHRAKGCSSAAAASARFAPTTMRTDYGSAQLATADSVGRNNAARTPAHAAVECTAACRLRAVLLPGLGRKLLRNLHCHRPADYLDRRTKSTPPADRICFRPRHDQQLVRPHRTRGDRDRR